MGDVAQLAETEKRIGILNKFLSKSEDGLEATIARAEAAATALASPGQVSTGHATDASVSTGSGCWAARTSTASGASGTSTADDGEWWNGGSARGRPPSPGRWQAEPRRRSLSADRLAQGLQRSSSAGLAARLSATGPRLSAAPRLSRPMVRASLHNPPAAAASEDADAAPRSPRFTLPPGSRPPGEAAMAAAQTPARHSSSIGRSSSFGRTVSGGPPRVGGAVPAAEATAHPSTPRARGGSGTSTPRGASGAASGASTPRGSAARLSVARRVRLDTNATPEEVDAKMRDALREVEPELRLALEIRLNELQAQLSSAKARVQETSKQNQLRRKQLDKQMWMEGQIRDKDMQNRLFEAREVESEDLFKDAAEDSVMLSRQIWERSRMCTEEAAHMQQLVAERRAQTKQYSHRVVSAGDDFQAAKRLLVPLSHRIAELEKIRVEAEKKARENAVMLKRVIAARHPQRWNV